MRPRRRDLTQHLEHPLHAHLERARRGPQGVQVLGRELADALIMRVARTLEAGRR